MLIIVNNPININNNIIHNKMIKYPNHVDMTPLVRLKIDAVLGILNEKYPNNTWSMILHPKDISKRNKSIYDYLFIIIDDGLVYSIVYSDSDKLNDMDVDEICAEMHEFLETDDIYTSQYLTPMHKTKLQKFLK